MPHSNSTTWEVEGRRNAVEVPSRGDCMEFEPGDAYYRLSHSDGRTFRLSGLEDAELALLNLDNEDVMQEIASRSVLVPDAT